MDAMNKHVMHSSVHHLLVEIFENLPRPILRNESVFEFLIFGVPEVSKKTLVDLYVLFGVPSFVYSKRK